MSGTATSFNSAAINSILFLYFVFQQGKRANKSIICDVSVEYNMPIGTMHHITYSPIQHNQPTSRSCVWLTRQTTRDPASPDLRPATPAAAHAFLCRAGWMGGLDGWPASKSMGRLGTALLAWLSLNHGPYFEMCLSLSSGPPVDHHQAFAWHCWCDSGRREIG
jgi:hypothetical protein